jgi:hypothetical protein
MHTGAAARNCSTLLRTHTRPTWHYFLALLLRVLADRLSAAGCCWAPPKFQVAGTGCDGSRVDVGDADAAGVPKGVAAALLPARTMRGGVKSTIETPAIHRLRPLHGNSANTGCKV